MQARICIFCAQALVDRSREHIIPQWLITHLELRDEDLFQGIAQTTDAELVEQRIHPTRNFVEGRVCTSCNNGWMSQMEGDTQQLLIALMGGERTVHALIDSERLLVSRWAAKTAFVLSYAAPMRASVPPDQLRSLRDNPHTLPSGVGVFANQHVPTGQASYMQKNHWPQFSTVEPVDDPERYKIALHFRHLLLLVAFWPPPSRLVLAAGMHVPIWPLDQVYPSYYPGIDVPTPYDSRSVLMRFSDTLAVLHPPQP